MKEEKLIKIRKKDHKYATGALWDLAKKTKDPKLIKEINKILSKRYEKSEN